MSSFPQITTERLFLNQLQVSDIPAIVAYASDKSISDYTLNLPYPYTEQDAVYWLNQAHQGFKTKTAYIFAIRLKENNAFAGGLALVPELRHSRAEISYWLGTPFWNKGYVTEAVNAAIRFGFETLLLHKMTAHYLEGNPASGRVMEKCGMTKEGELPDHIQKDGVFHTAVLYGIVNNFRKASPFQD